jgi:hypothetical protein
MGETSQGFGNGILKGLKKVLFSSSPEETTVTPSPNQPATNTGSRPPQPTPKAAPAVDNPSFSQAKMPESDTEVKDMKLRVYQLLEQMNKPGVDFFEVWNAAVEMGGANGANLKSAVTSLRFADKSLSKTRLIESGKGYVSGLQAIFETESKKRSEEKAQIAGEKEQVRTGLTAEIESLQQQITTLQAKMDSQQQKLLTLDETYNPRLKEIEQKIKTGSDAVNSVLHEMQQVLHIIEKDIN